MAEDELLTPVELAGITKVPIGTIYQWNYTGAGPRRVRVGRHIRYRQSDVDAWLKGQEVATSTSA